MRLFAKLVVPIAVSLLGASPIQTNVDPATPRAGAACTLDRSTATTLDPTPVIPSGYGATFNAVAERIAFSQSDPATGYYRVMTMSANGTDVRPFDAGSFRIPRKHQGTPSWLPEGRRLIFIAQKSTWSGHRLFGIPDYEALPGYGRHDDLWIATADGRDAIQLTNEPNTKDEGILIPVISHDGRRVAWSDRQPGGTYELRVADLIDLPQPHLSAARTYLPGGHAYYETGSFSSDGTSMVYTSDQDTHLFFHSQIYRLDLATGTSTRLTDGPEYDEHPIIIPTPSGDWIVYMSSRDVRRLPGHLLLGTDWWAMRLDGTGTKRLTTMNAPNSPENTGAMQVAGRVSQGPSPDILFGDIQDSLVKQTGYVKRVHLVCN